MYEEISPISIGMHLVGRQIRVTELKTDEVSIGALDYVAGGSFRLRFSDGKKRDKYDGCWFPTHPHPSWPFKYEIWHG